MSRFVFFKRDQRNRRSFFQNEKRKKILYFCLSRKEIGKKNKSRMAHMLFKTRIKRQVSFTRIKNICLITKNTRSIIRKYKLSRWALRKFFHEGSISGLKKRSF